MIAALYVATNGPYYGIEGVDPWDAERDARSYDGPPKVIAHPPCERWGRYWSGGPNPNARRFELGDDGGCFEAALKAVRQFGGVLEHPEGSHAWKKVGIAKPPKSGGWVKADDRGGWTCCVEQGNYGHAARKATWLYAIYVDTPELKWGPATGKMRIDDGFRSKEAAKAARSDPNYVPVKRLSVKERIHTPNEFRDLLISIARSGW